jgi:hypothetical protein
LISFEKNLRRTERAFADCELIQGRFEIVRHLVSGGMGEVYEAIDRQLGRIAVKTARSSVVADPQPSPLMGFRS